MNKPPRRTTTTLLRAISDRLRPRTSVYASAADAPTAEAVRGGSIVVVLLASLGALALWFVLVAAPAADALPSDRAYEMATPPDKNYGDVGAGLTPSESRAAPDGNSIAYSVAAGFGDAAANTLTSGYLATRGDDFWSSTATTIPIASIAAITYFGPVEVSPDLSKVVVQTNMNQETGEELPAGTPYAWYLYDPATKEADRMTPPSPDGSDYEMDKALGAENMSGDTDFSHIYFGEDATLTTDAVGITGDRLYRYANGNLSLASRDADGNPISGSLASTIVGTKDIATPYAVSENGSVVFYNRGTASTRGELFRSDYGSGSTPDTVVVNASENSTETVPVGSALFVGASADGSIAYFTSDQPLVDADTDTAKDLYRWDETATAGSHLTLISTGGDPASAAQMGVGVGADGETVYFTHFGQLLPEAPDTTDLKLYVWHDGDLDYIAHRAQFGTASYVSSANGQHFAFLSNVAGTTPEDNGGKYQVYAYDLATGDLECASCASPPGVNTHDATLEPNGLSLAQLTDEQRRSISNSGDVFFDTVDALLPQDTNQMRDVYTWKDGQVQLISSGRSKYDSQFADASVDGKDVFFRTYERLSGWDVDDHADLYDARVDGGLPEPPPPDVPCSGPACQGPPSLPPADVDPGTSTYEGGGNQAARVCKKLDRKAERTKHKVRKLKRQARRLRADGKKRKAKRVTRRAKQVKRTHRRAARRADRCARGVAK